MSLSCDAAMCSVQVQFINTLPPLAGPLAIPFLSTRRGARCRLLKRNKPTKFKKNQTKIALAFLFFLLAHCACDFQDFDEIIVRLHIFVYFCISNSKNMIYDHGKVFLIHFRQN